jgi:hypothetical protein
MRANIRNGVLLLIVTMNKPDMTRVIQPHFVLLFVLASFHALAQTNNIPATNSQTSRQLVSTNFSPIELSEQLRVKCIYERRSICGKILRIFPDGLLIECGYTNLLRESLTSSWLLPQTVVASRADNLVESTEPNALCIGTVFLTDLPRGKPHQYDYVVISGYPMGQYNYRSVGSVTKTVRRFSASLESAIKWNFAEAQKTQSQPSGTK